MAANCPMSKAGTRFSEANRIFGFDGWNRETVKSKCVLARENRDFSWQSTSLGCASPFMQTARPSFGKAMAPAKATARHGRGARHRAQGRRKRRHQKGAGDIWKTVPPGVYRGGRTTPSSQKPLPSPPTVPVPADVRLDFHPDDTTPIPRPSRYYGRRQDVVTRDRARADANWKCSSPPAPRLFRSHPASYPAKSTRASSPSPSPNGCVTKPI